MDLVGDIHRHRISVYEVPLRKVRTRFVPRLPLQGEICFELSIGGTRLFLRYQNPSRVASLRSLQETGAF